MNKWTGCKKQRVRCTVVLEDGTIIEGENRCKVSSFDKCPREIADAKSGELYELCGPPLHAEVDAAGKIPAGNVGGTAYLQGHTYFCGDCQHTLSAKGVKTFKLSGPLGR